MNKSELEELYLNAIRACNELVMYEIMRNVDPNNKANQVAYNKALNYAKAAIAQLNTMPMTEGIKI